MLDSRLEIKWQALGIRSAIGPSEDAGLSEKTIFKMRRRDLITATWEEAIGVEAAELGRAEKEEKRLFRHVILNEIARSPPRHSTIETTRFDSADAAELTELFAPMSPMPPAAMIEKFMNVDSVSSTTPKYGSRASLKTAFPNLETFGPHCLQTASSAVALLSTVGAKYRSAWGSALPLPTAAPASASGAQQEERRASTKTDAWERKATSEEGVRSIRSSRRGKIRLVMERYTVTSCRLEYDGSLWRQRPRTSWQAADMSDDESDMSFVERALDALSRSSQKEVRTRGGRGWGVAAVATAAPQRERMPVEKEVAWGATSETMIAHCRRVQWKEPRALQRKEVR
jgi:hypothetical protein